jgi:membrane-associated phospholipid phosphatase
MTCGKGFVFLNNIIGRRPDYIYFFALMKSNLIKKIVLFFLLLADGQMINAQQVYRLSYAADCSVTGVGVATWIPGFILYKKKTVLTDTQVEMLNKNDIMKIDRFAVNFWNTNVARSSDVVMFTSMTLPGLLFISKQVRNEAGIITLMYAQTCLLNAGLTGLTKELTQRKRPFVYNPDVPLSVKLQRDATSSFYSGHTSFTAASAFFMAKVFADTHPDSKWKPYVWTGAAILPLTTAVLRVRAGKHFLTDVLTGYIAGAVTGIIVPHLHLSKRRSLFP